MAVDIVQDADRGEYRRETGYGQIERCDLKPGGRNAEVVINAEQLSDPIRGWVDSQGEDRPVYVAAVHAFAQGQRIYYRIETHRKEGVDPSIPFADLTKQQKVRDLREITAVNGEGVPLTEVGTAPDAETAPAPADRAAPTRGPRVEEGKPWQALNSDGSLNMGSYQFQACEGILLLAHDLLIDRWREGHLGEPPTEGQLRGLARRLLAAADHAQASTRHDGHADRMDNSHSRARAAVKVGLEVHPVPWGASPEVLDQWVTDLSTYAALLLSLVRELTDLEVP